MMEITTASIYPDKLSPIDLNKLVIKSVLIKKANNDSDILDLDAPVARPEKADNHKNQYDTFFE